MTLLRTRWSALGAAIAVSLGAGGVGLSQAALNSGDKPVFVAITPCRLIDTRPGAANVGDRSTPLAANETIDLQVTGSTGECSGIPADATAAAMNVTAIQGTAQSFLSVYPGDDPIPNASNLNWGAGDPPTPNQVDVGLSGTGGVKFTNSAGTVHVAADLVGYYVDHTHDDRYYTKGQVDELVDAGGGTGLELSIPATSFHVRSPASDRQIGSGGQFAVVSGTDDLAYASVQLPDGAVITGLRAWAWDDSALTMRIQLRSVGNSSGYSTHGDPILTTGASAATTEYSTAVPNYVVDLASRSVVIQVDVSDGDWSAAGFDLRLQHVIVEYTL